MGNVVRIGDAVSCGDRSAQGSGNVFVEGMAVTHRGRRRTTGHGCFPPTDFNGPWTSTVFVNNQPVAIRGKTKIVPHRCKKNTHDGVASSSARTVTFE